MFIKVVYSLRTAWVMANNFVSLYSHSPYLSCFYFMSPIEKLSDQHNKIPTYYFSLTLHVYSLIDNRAEIGHWCLIWQEKRECWGNEVFIHVSFENEFCFFIFRFVFCPQAFGEIGHRKRVFSKTFSRIGIFEHAVKFPYCLVKGISDTRWRVTFENELLSYLNN